MAELQDGIPLVSCVIPFLNGEKFIGETIESVLAQTWSNWELILVNDGTTDGAADIARRYCAAHPERIRCISHPGGRNLGPGASRNAGVREARGAYLAFVDADDIWLPERLEAHVAMFERHPEADLVIGPTLRWSSWNGTDAAWWRPWQTLDEPNVLGLATDVVLRPPEVAAHFLERHGAGMPPPCCVTMRREAILALGGCDEAFFRSLYEDQVLFFKFFLEHPIVATGRLLDLYRQHSGSACAVAGWETGDSAARPGFLDWLRRRIEALGIEDARLGAALDVEIERAARRGTAPLPPLPSLVGRARGEARKAVTWVLTPRQQREARRQLGFGQDLAR